MGYASASFDPALVAQNSDAASSAFAEADAASAAAAAASSKIAAQSSVWEAGGGGISSVVDDTSPALGGDLSYNEKNQVFDIALTSSGTAAGDIITVTFGESVVFGNVVYPNPTDNEWKKALGTNAATTFPAMGIALETKSDGQTGKLLLRGTIRDDTIFSGAAAGDIVYLSDGTAGLVVYAAPSDSGDIVQILGFALGSGYIFFNPDYTFVEV